jgi:xanthine dehydrogenase accessory factor
MPDRNFSACKVLLRGGGDLGSGVAYRLLRSGFPVLISELDHPLLLRQTVSFGSAVYEGEVNIEGIRAVRMESIDQVDSVLAAGLIPVLVDPAGLSVETYRPQIVIDARMLKSPPAPLPGQHSPVFLIGLGPGFTAPLDCHALIETNRGHYLGRVIWQGSAQPDTGLPGDIGSHSADRILRAPAAGVVSAAARIGDVVRSGQEVMRVASLPVTAPIDGVVRGMIRSGSTVSANAKIGDVDPRADPSYCFTISDKSLAIAGGVLEAILSFPALQPYLMDRHH